MKKRQRKKNAKKAWISTGCFWDDMLKDFEPDRTGGKWWPVPSIVKPINPIAIPVVVL
jgi:hypothetical protein